MISRGKTRGESAKSAKFLDISLFEMSDDFTREFTQFRDASGHLDITFPSFLTYTRVCATRVRGASRREKIKKIEVRCQMSNAGRAGANHAVG